MSSHTHNTRTLNAIFTQTNESYRNYFFLLRFWCCYTLFLCGFQLVFLLGFASFLPWTLSLITFLCFLISLRARCPELIGLESVIGIGTTGFPSHGCCRYFFQFARHSLFPHRPPTKQDSKVGLRLASALFGVTTVTLLFTNHFLVSGLTGLDATVLRNPNTRSN